MAHLVKVSFVIPTRNQARFIRRCLDSCLSQEIGDAEILVQDGASSDDTPGILAGYGDRIRWRSEADSGQAQAVNRAVARASGEIVAWVNSDDFYPDGATLPAVVAAFDSDPAVDVVYGGALAVDEAGRPLRPHRTREMRRLADLLTSPTGPSMQPAVFFRRRLYLQAGGLREDLHYAMDYDLWLRMFPLARAMRFLPRPLACATFHGGAKSIRGMRNQIEEIAALKRAYAPVYHLGAWDRLLLWGGVAALYAYWGAVRLGVRRAT